MCRYTVYTPYVYIYIYMCAYAYRKPRPPSPARRRARQARPDSGTPRVPGQSFSAPRPRSPSCLSRTRTGAWATCPPPPSRGKGLKPQGLKATRVVGRGGKADSHAWARLRAGCSKKTAAALGLLRVLTDGV